MTTLIINNSTIELEPSLRIPLNIQASNAQEIGTLLTSFSNSFLIPATDNNNLILGNTGRVQSTDNTPYQTLSCTLLLNGRDLFGISRLVILESSPGLYGWRVAFFAGTTNFALNGNLRDLDLSSYNFVLSTANAAARANTTSGVLYAPINYGVNNLVREVDIVYSSFQLCYHLNNRNIQNGCNTYSSKKSI